MMLGEGKKPALAIALMGKEPDEDDSEDTLSVGKDEKRAAGAVSSALKSGDSTEIAKALKAFIKICGGY